MGTLTVKENITMSANLRLPKYVSAKERKQRIENILVELGLTNCANSKVIYINIYKHMELTNCAMQL